MHTWIHTVIEYEMHVPLCIAVKVLTETHSNALLLFDNLCILHMFSPFISCWNEPANAVTPPIVPSSTLLLETVQLYCPFSPASKISVTRVRIGRSDSSTSRIISSSGTAIITPLMEQLMSDGGPSLTLKDKVNTAGTTSLAETMENCISPSTSGPSTYICIGQEHAYTGWKISIQPLNHTRLSTILAISLGSAIPYHCCYT